MTLSKAIKLLGKCESDLRALVADAADGGDYDSVLRITSWAREIGTMVASTSSTTPEKVSSSTSPKKAAVPRPKYPQFQRRGDHLIKVGWSKRKKSEYEHKAPRQAALALAESVANVGKDGRIFQVTALSPLVDPNDGTEIPDYQVYIVIAWWRTVGLLEQHGRQGYSVPNASQLRNSMESYWANLPEK